MKKTIQRKATAGGSKNGTKPISQRTRTVSPKANRAQYRNENGQHIVELAFGEGAFTALQVLAQALGPRTVEEHVLHTVCEDTAQCLPQLTESEAREIVQWRGEQRSEVPTPNRKIVLEVPEKAYAIWHGCALRDGYDCIEHMILRHEAAMCAQSPGDHDEKEYYAMFGLKVDETGDTSMPLSNRAKPAKSKLNPRRLEPLRIA
jgi:hypothetical protein